jgi:hypothetical protein
MLLRFMLYFHTLVSEAWLYGFSAQLCHDTWCLSRL